MSNPRAKHKMHYKLRSARGLNTFDVQEVGRAIDQIRERDGGVQPAVVLEEATAEDSPLHPPFEWDDQTAGHHYRLWQARMLVRNVVGVYYEKNAAGERIEREVPLIHVPAAENEPAQYRTPDSLAADPDALTRAYEDALQALRVAQRRVSELESIMRHADQGDRMDVIRVALKGLETAQTALERLH